MLSHRLGTTSWSVNGLLPHRRETQCSLSASQKNCKKSLTRRGRAEASGNTESISADYSLVAENSARNGLESTGDLRDLFRRADINR